MSEERESRQRRRARERAAAKQQRYEWPEVTAIHREHGSYKMDIHGLRAPDGHIVLVAFLGKDTTKQVDLVRSTSTNMNYPIVDLEADDISDDIGLRLAAQFHANPGADVVLLEVARPGEAGASR